MKISRTVETTTAPDRVFAFLSDFTTTEEWDPGTVRTTLTEGDGGVGSVYRNVSKFLGRETELDYTVTELEPGRRFVVRGVNKSVETTDSMDFSEAAGGGTRVRYDADFRFQGVAGRLTPVLFPVMWLALKRLGDEAETSLGRTLDGL